MKTELTEVEMTCFLAGVGIDREEKPNCIEDLAGQRWVFDPERRVYELAEAKEEGC